MKIMTTLLNALSSNGNSNEKEQPMTIETITPNDLKKANEIIKTAYLLKRIISLTDAIRKEGKAFNGIREAGKILSMSRRVLMNLVPADGIQVEWNEKTIVAKWKEDAIIPFVTIEIA